MSIAKKSSRAIASTLCSEITLTDRYQTTIVQSDGTVAIARVTQTESDPILKPFLDLLAQDIEHNPQRLQPISSELIDRIRSIVSDVDVDLNESIDEDR
jgi:antitoxin PrlF